MALPSRHSLPSFSLKQKLFLIFLLLISLPSLIIVIISEKKHQKPPSSSVVVGITALSHDHNNNNNVQATKPAWFDVIAKDIKEEKIKIGLVNIHDDEDIVGSLQHLHPKVETVTVNFDHVNESLKWKDLYPEWIDEDEKWGKGKCPEMPTTTTTAEANTLNVVVARVPESSCGVVFRLQLNLVVANLAVESGWVSWEGYDPRVVYVVFVSSSSSCGPMEEIFRCDDLLMHNHSEEGVYYWVYKPDLRSLKLKTLMPIGSCQISPAYAESGKEKWRLRPEKQEKQNSSSILVGSTTRIAYVTILHSSELYVCGAIALAHSILRNPDQDIRVPPETKDLLLLADDSISSESLTALRAAGWNKIKRIQRIQNPFANKSSHNEWNYSKLRLWELTMYEKIIFLDSDVLVLKSLDGFFYYPQLSAAPNEKTMFNSGVMVIEPSQCMFESMLKKIHKVKSYNEGDQGFLNEVFAWWHRTPSKLNKLKVFRSNNNDEKRDEILPEDLYAIHYLGLKPWMCDRDYDCNRDREDYRMFASDVAHQKWWQVYDSLPKHLQSYCGNNVGLARRSDV
ncbi:hypothetical protein PIB30_028487 [Stylosanthes scabra]|uniref:Hexosyltransferase n=1 Tax=Stylosanthes scabra TaxID=79078 RepID=A0ABU6Z9G5_9FABA|nr:hypothetical protein [Stylosanthes scabra]